MDELVYAGTVIFLFILLSMGIIYAVSVAEKSRVQAHPPPAVSQDTKGTKCPYPWPPSSRYDYAVFFMINAERQRHGLRQLSWSSYWANRAKKWAHVLVVKRVKQHSAPPIGVSWGEIIAYTESGSSMDCPSTPDEYVEGWLHSQEHREIMMGDKWLYMGVGCDCNVNHDFCACVVQFSTVSQP